MEEEEVGAVRLASSFASSDSPCFSGSLSDLCFSVIYFFHWIWDHLLKSVLAPHHSAESSLQQLEQWLVFSNVLSCCKCYFPVQCLGALVWNFLLHRMHILVANLLMESMYLYLCVIIHTY